MTKATDTDLAARRRRGPSPAKTAATRQALVEAALRLFLERGYAATRVSDVAEAAGLAKGTVYLHFADKAALFAAALREVLRDARSGLPTPRPRFGEPTDAFLRRTMPAILRGLQASGRFGIVRLVAVEGGRDPEMAEIYRRTVIVPVLRLVRVMARRAERRGELRADALSRLPILMVAPVVLATLWNMLFVAATPLDLAEVFESYLDLLFVKADPHTEGRGAAASP